jgi:ferritin
MINERLREESTASKVVEQIKMTGDNQTGIIMLDRELGARAFPPGTPIDPVDYSAAT